MIPKKKTSIALSTLTLSAAVGLSLLPTDSNAQRGGRGGDRDVYGAAPPVRVAPPVYQDFRHGGNRFDRDHHYGHNHGAEGGNGTAIRFNRNVERLDELADKMVWQARYDMVRSRTHGASSVYRAVSQHALLTEDLVKASRGSCPVALRQAALAVDNSIRTMSDRRHNRVHSNSASCSTDPILALINESKAPSAFVVQNLRFWNQTNRAYVDHSPNHGARGRGNNGIVNKPLSPGDILAAFLGIGKH